MLSCCVYAARGDGEAPEPAAVRADTVLSLPQVSVTAVKIGSQLRRKPLSSTVIGAPEIARCGIVNMHQISDVVPNFYMPRYGSRITSSIYVRGIGARIDQPAVGLTVDNIPVLNKDNYDFDLDDMVRVDMIRGPQSTMYGRNTMCGLINITTLSPLQYSGIRLKADGGSYGSYRASVGAYHRFGDKFGGAAGTTVAGSDGYYRNGHNGRLVGGEKQWSAWYKAVWRPYRDWSVENTGRFYHNSQSGYPYESFGTGMIAYNDTCFYRRNSWLNGLTAAWRRGQWSVTSVTSVQHIDDNMTLDQDFLPASYFTLTQRRRETSVTQDFIVDRRGGRYDFLAGLFGFTRHTSMRAPVTFMQEGIDELILKYPNQMNSYRETRWDEPSFVLNSDFSHPTRGIGIYHNSTYRLGRFTFAGALRLEIERPSLDYHSYVRTSYTAYRRDDPLLDPETTVVDLDESGVLSHTYVELLPKVSVMYGLQGNVAGNVYASFSKGYKPGGFNTQMFSDFLQQKLMEIMGITARYDISEIVGYKPEESYNYEVGGHFSMLGGRLSADASVFYIDCRNQQLTRFPDGTTTGRIMDNAGRTRSIGAELSAEYHMSSHWIFNVSWGHADARFVDYNDGIHDYSRRFVPYAPLNTFYGAVRFDSSIPSWHIDRIQIVAGVRGVGRIYWNEDNTASQPFYAPVQLSASATSGIFTLRLWGENLNRVKYSTFYFKSIGNEFVQRGAPLTVGVSLGVDIDSR